MGLLKCGLIICTVAQLAVCTMAGGPYTVHYFEDAACTVSNPSSEPATFTRQPGNGTCFEVTVPETAGEVSDSVHNQLVCDATGLSVIQFEGAGCSGDVI